ncbi:MAG: ComF family protein [Spirochaetota bacterium]
MTYLARAEDWFLNRLCRSCGTPLVLCPDHTGLICRECRVVLQRSYLSGRLCECCGSPLLGGLSPCRHCREHPPAYTNHRSVFLYTSLPATLVVDFKGRGFRRLAAYFAETMLTVLPPCDLLVPVPFRPASVRQRPFDPVTLLVRELSRLSTVPSGFILNRRAGRSQKSLSREDRLTNLDGAIRLNRHRNTCLRGLSLCLIDDVFTTGATVHQCARVLLQDEPAAVYVRTIAMD